jgi:hypothetical protein
MATPNRNGGYEVGNVLNMILRIEGIIAGNSIVAQTIK